MALFRITGVYPVPSDTSVSYPDDLSTEGKGPKPIFLNFKARTNLVDLVGQFVNSRRIEGNNRDDEGDGFDAILFAEIDDNVNVVFLASSARMRIASLDNLTSVPDGVKIDLKLLGQSTNMADVKVGAGDYKPFFQPVKLPLARIGSGKQQDINLLACGFVDSGRFRRESWSIPYTVLIVFGFLAVLVALSWPFIKLLLIGPKDRFRPIDTYLLIVSAILITALLTFFGSFVHGYMRAERLLDNELGTFAGAIQSNFDKELLSALKEIDNLNCHPKLLESGFDRPTYCKEDTKEASPNPTPSVSTTNRLPDRRTRILVEDQLELSLLQVRVWADNLGNQRIKWTVRQNLTNNPPVTSRSTSTNYSSASRTHIATRRTRNTRFTCSQSCRELLARTKLLFQNRSIHFPRPPTECGFRDQHTTTFVDGPGSAFRVWICRNRRYRESAFPFR